jgi:hypothetical protein
LKVRDSFFHSSFAIVPILLVSALGCGTTQSQMATQQLLMSDAVDRSVERFDFAPLAGKKVYLDGRYVETLKTIGFVNSDYVVSAIRQQMFAAGCQLQESKDDADYVVEARVGALATDGHEVTYGIPPSKSISSAASVLPNVPDIPTMPEIALAKRQDQVGAAKVAVFAYDRITRVPVWQSGTSVAMSDAKNTWFLGAGPFQSGTIYKGTRFAGSKLMNPLNKKLAADDQTEPPTGVAISTEHTFPQPALQQPQGVMIPAAHTAAHSQSNGDESTSSGFAASGG